MMTHPFIGDLASKSSDELMETINKLNKQMQFMFKTGKPEMVNQIQMVLASYRTEYYKRQQEMWDKKSQNLDKNIDIG
jgi:hypothetical protein